MRVNDQEFREVGRSISRTVRIWLGFAAAISCLCNWIFLNNAEHAVRYEEIIAKSSKHAESEEIRLGEEFFDCIREVSGDEKVGSRNSNNNNNPNLLAERNTLVNEIKDYLQQKRINIHNLNIYLLKEIPGQEGGNWRIIRGWKFFITQLPKALIVDNLTRVVSFIQGFFAPRVRTENFLFYSEVFIKVLTLKLLIWILASETPFSLLSSSFLDPEAGRSYERLFEGCYGLFITFLPLSYSLISRSPPPYVQQIGFGGWAVLYLCTILVSNFLEEYAEKNTIVFPEDEGRSIFLRRNFQLRVITEIVVNILASYFLSFHTENSGRVLFIANRLLSAVIGIMYYWKNKLDEKINEKAL